MAVVEASSKLNFDKLSDVIPGRDSWKIKVRVLRVWTVPTFLNPSQPNSIELVLIDEHGGKIQATIRKQLIYLFKDKFIEGEAYKMSFFSVGPMSGAYRSTVHPYKLLFQIKTRVEAVKSSEFSFSGVTLREGGPVVSISGFSLMKCGEIAKHSADHNYLVDVIGVMTGISVEREYVRDGKVTKMVVFELTDDSGKCECALFGEYVKELNRMVTASAGSMPIVVVQFAKIKVFRERASIQNVMNTTKISVNPSIPEVIAFKDSVAVHGVELFESVPIIGARVRPSIEDDFLRTFPKKNLIQLKELVEDGVFVVIATVLGFAEGEEWWYPACKCHKGVVPDSGSYYCKGCDKHVLQMIPRFRVKVMVSDGTDDAIFVLFDTDMQNMINKACSQLLLPEQVFDDMGYPKEFESLKGKTIIFKVEKRSLSSSRFDGSYRVKRICDDSSIMEKFCADGYDYTPVKVPSSCILNDIPEAKIIDSTPVEHLEDIQADEFVSSLIVTPQAPLKTVNPSMPIADIQGVKNKNDLVISNDISTSLVNPQDASYLCDEVDSEFVKETQDVGCTPSLGYVSPGLCKPGCSRNEGANSVKRNLSDVFEGLEDLNVQVPLKAVKIEKD